MPVISLVTQKGGCGKTTLTTCLAVIAQQTGRHVMILDTDPQATASQWWESREEKTPALLEVKREEIARAVAVVQDKGFDLVIIDTPARAEPINAAVAQMADFCLLPCQPSLVDMRAQSPTVQTLKHLEKRGAFVLTRCPPRGSRTKEAERGLLVFGLPVSPMTIGNRAAYPDAYGSGLGVTEYEPVGKAAEEMRALWTWILHKMEKVV